MSNFKKKEFACKCGCGFDSINPSLLKFLDIVRNIIGYPIYVNSACRCKEHNSKVGGKPNSYHLKGMAADIRTDWSKTTKKRFIYVLCCYFNGVIEYDDFIHVDVRSYVYHKLKGDGSNEVVQEDAS